MNQNTSTTVDLETIKTIVTTLDLIPLIEEGFAAYSNGQSVVPPVGELQLDKGEVHIKYGFIESQQFYVIKIASGFYGNTELGLSSSGGCILVFSQETGQLVNVLLDGGHLTDTRTAVAGAIVAKHLAPKKVNRIGIVGTGIQALMQLNHLRNVVDCSDVLVWGRSPKSVQEFLARVQTTEIAQEPGLQICCADSIKTLQRQCNLIVTTTPSCEPLLAVEHLQPGTHITAVGSDMPEKQELESQILAQADIVVADSIEQCKTRGEIAHAMQDGEFDNGDVIELGDIIAGKKQGRTSDQQITVADLTGVAVQDIQIATAVANSVAKSRTKAKPLKRNRE